MRFSDNHDERRAIARFGEKGALAASVLMFTLDGVPMLYNGMEAGDTTESGAPALFERLPVFWQMRERRPEFPRLYKSLIEMRKQHASLRSLNLEWVKNSEDARVISYLRRDAAEEILVVVNFSNRPVSSVVDAGKQNFVDVTPDISAPVPSDATANERAARKVQNRVVMLPNVLLDAWEFRVFRRALR